jgi:hypothetical protein
MRKISLFAVVLIFIFTNSLVQAQNYRDSPPRTGTYPSPCQTGSSCNTVNVGSMQGRGNYLSNSPSGVQAPPPPSPPRQ